MQKLEDFVNTLNGFLFHEYVVYALLATGVLFTFWSVFGQYRAMTHGVGVIRGKYDEKGDPGAINHFQALSAALSATVGLGNIGGVAVAVALGGPGAVFWMWIIGVVGMALKMTEVTQSMLYRNTDDPENPHGGPMFVVAKGLAEMSPALKPLGILIGGVFCITLLISAITGGNMFQAWNVAEVTHQYFPEVPKQGIGIVLAVLVGLVIIGGIKRIGAVAGRIVPFMCAMYLIAGILVLIMKIDVIPEMVVLIVKQGLGLESASASQAFLGGTFGFAMMWGIKRALFSSEAGQGSAPIAHAAAKTNEPVREGVVAGIEPFIDTVVVCTITALVILCSGAFDRGHESDLGGVGAPQMVNAERIWLDLNDDGTQGDDESLDVVVLTDVGEEIEVLVLGIDEGDADPIRTIAAADLDVGKASEFRGEELARIREANAGLDADATPFSLAPLESPGAPGRVVLVDKWAPDEPMLGGKNKASRDINGEWKPNNGVFILVEGDYSSDQDNNMARLFGSVRRDIEGEADGPLVVSWLAHTSETGQAPTFHDEGEIHVFGNYVGASLTAHAFDRVVPGLGMWLVVIAAWLFALSTMISWSYYGEQGVVFLAGTKPVLVYKLIYCLLIVVSTLGFIKTDAQLDMWTTLGLGCMLVANIPIMLIFGPKAMRAYHSYMGKLKRGEFHPHAPSSITDVVEGKDVE